MEGFHRGGASLPCGQRNPEQPASAYSTSRRVKRRGRRPRGLRLIREIHGILLEGVRGSHKNPGEFRRSQNWIGPEGSDLNTAAFIPPPVHEMKQSLGNLEKVLHDRTAYHDLINCGISHAQFETIHPFLGGNGKAPSRQAKSPGPFVFRCFSCPSCDQGDDAHMLFDHLALFPGS